MELHIQYLTDDHGCKTAVQIPLDEWRRLADDYRHLRQQDTLRGGLEGALREARAQSRKKAKPVTLGEFLDEC